jgi:hypothetical protein
MKVGVRLMFLMTILMTVSAQAMQKGIKLGNKIKVKKMPKDFASSKNIQNQPHYIGTSLTSKETIDSEIHQSVQIPSSIKMKELPRSAWQQKRSYSTAINERPFKNGMKSFGLKTEQAKRDLQKRGYSTEVRKVALIEKTTNDLKQGKNSLLKDESVLQRFGKFMSPKSMQQFIRESGGLSWVKAVLIYRAKEKGIYIPIDASEEVRLAYGGMIDRIKAFFKDGRNKSFLPMIDRALAQEKSALAQGKPVLYHGLKKDYYKYMYFCTKIMELKELFYPGFLMLRASQKDYTPEGKSTTIRKSFLKKGSDNDHDIKDRYHLLSTSNSLFINFESVDTRPLNLVVEDRSIGKPNIDLESFCKKYQLEDYYTKIWDMFRSTDIKSDGGILLQFILSKDLFDKTVYASYAVGVKRDDSSGIIKNMPNAAALDNETLRRLQFRMILTDDFLLNPTNPEVRKGFKVKAYAQDQKALYEFQATVDEFFDGIKKELLQKKKEEERENTWDSIKRWFGFGKP